MRSKTRILLAAVLALQARAPGRVFAEEAIGLPEAIETALRLDPALAALASRHGAVQDRKAGAFAPSEPNFSVTKFEDGRVDRTISQSFGFPGKAAANARALEAEADGLDAQAKGRRAEVSATVKRAYASLWIARKKRGVLAVKRDSFDKILASAKKRSVKDTTTEIDYLNTQLAATRIDDDDATLAAEERSRLAELNILLGRKPEQALELREPAVPAYPPPRWDVQALAASAALQGPSLLQARSAEKVSRRHVSVARSAYLPDVQVSAISNNPEGAQFGAGITVPIWGWFGERRGVEAANKELSARQSELAGTERAVVLDIESRVAGLQALGSKLDNHSKRLLPLSEKGFAVALRNYGFGKVDYPALSAAAEGWFGAQDSYYSLLEAYAAAWADLESRVGVPLP